MKPTAKLIWPVLSEAEVIEFNMSQHRPMQNMGSLYSAGSINIPGKTITELSIEIKTKHCTAWFDGESIEKIILDIGYGNELQRWELRNCYLSYKHRHTVGGYVYYELTVIPEHAHSYLSPVRFNDKEEAVEKLKQIFKNRPDKRRLIEEFLAKE